MCVFLTRFSRNNFRRHFISVYSGAKIGIVGSNGSGKTTLLKIIQNSAEKLKVVISVKRYAFLIIKVIRSYILSAFTDLGEIYEKISLLESKLNCLRPKVLF
jgi:ABC-type polysaccharide/polyol phosphate transport system ATPase subunit